MAGKNAKEARPTGREDVVAALVEAAADLFSEKGIEAVSVREIAEKAGVNHGLVHRHFGSKAELATRVGEYLDGKIREAVGEATSFVEALSRASVAVREDPRIWHYTARRLLDGRQGGMPEGSGDYLGVLAGLAARDAENGVLGSASDPREIVLILASLGLGMELFGDYLCKAVGIPTLNLPSLEDRYRDIFLAIFGAK